MTDPLPTTGPNPSPTPVLGTNPSSGSTTNDILFTRDPGVLFRDNNWRQFDMDNLTQQGNTCAKILFYVSLLLALRFRKIRYLVCGLLGIFVIGVIYEQKLSQERAVPIDTGSGQIGNANMDTYPALHRAARLPRVHDKSLGPSNRAQRATLKNQVLANVKEHNHYMGENLGVPDPYAAEELMFGGTRYPSANNSRAYREHPFFTGESRAAQTAVTYTPVIPVHEI